MSPFPTTQHPRTRTHARTHTHTQTSPPPPSPLSPYLLPPPPPFPPFPGSRCTLTARTTSYASSPAKSGSPFGHRPSARASAPKPQAGESRRTQTPATGALRGRRI
eukprot:scaffold25898_cov79-Isochrysis_galbana.AAC.3